MSAHLPAEAGYGLAKGFALLLVFIAQQ